MKRYSIGLKAAFEDPQGKYGRFEDMQSLAKEVLIYRLMHLRGCATACTCGLDALRNKLKSICEDGK